MDTSPTESTAFVPAPMEERRAFYESLVGAAINGTWQLERLVDFGSMGAVFEARHKADETAQHAIKILDPDLPARDRRYLRRFIREARILETIDHVNVVKVFEHGMYQPPDQDEALYYTVMELIRGPDGPPLTLHSFATSRQLRMEEVVYIISQLLAGLRYVHSKGVIHRDLKPWNVLIDEEGRCRIVDFGLAKIPDSDLTLVDELFGSRDYIAPELFYRGAREATPAADLYAVGRIFTDLVDRVDFARHGAGVFASKAAALRYLNELLERLVQEDPELRFGSAEDVMRVLEDFSESTKIRTTVNSAARLKKAAQIRNEEFRRRTTTFARWFFDYGLFVLGIALLPFVIAISPFFGAILAGSLVTSKLWSAFSHPPGRHPIRIVVRALAARLERVLKEGDFRVQFYAARGWSLRTTRFRALHISQDLARAKRGLDFDEGVGVVGTAMAARSAVLLHTVPRWGTAPYRDLFENHLRVPREMWTLFDPTRRSHFAVPLFRIVRRNGTTDLEVVGVLTVDSRLPDAFLRTDPQRAVKEYAAVIQDVLAPGHRETMRQIAADGAAPLETLLINGQEPVVPPLGPKATFTSE